MSIKNWPEDERPREKLLKSGPASLSDAELLAIFLRTGTRGQNAVDLARNLISQFGSLRQLLTANRQEFCSQAGLGSAKFAQLQAVLEMAKRHQWQLLSRQASLTDPLQSQDYLKTRLRDYNHEVFGCLFLDNRHRVICFDEMFRGSIDGASVYPREILQQAFKHNAAAVIFAHNHPSGVANPSQADHQITRKLCQALAMVDIRVLDHIIIGDRDCYSFAAHGLI